jgi:hypothetical protein
MAADCDLAFQLTDSATMNGRSIHRSLRPLPRVPNRPTSLPRREVTARNPLSAKTVLGPSGSRLAPICIPSGQDSPLRQAPTPKHTEPGMSNGD